MRLANLQPWRFWARGERSTGDPAADLFQRTGWWLSLTYAGALLILLLLFGIGLYIAMQHTLLDPVKSDLETQAQGIAQEWAQAPFPICPLDHVDGLVACYDASGHLVTATRESALVPNFTNSALISQALQNGSAADIIDEGKGIGAIERYAFALRGNQGALGVIMVGGLVGGQIHALHVLLTLLFILGAITVLAALVAGVFLADRALAPLRLAYRRQRDFIADASHELRTPLTMLRADAEVLLRSRKRLYPDDAELVEDMVAETTHMAALANSMLDMARLDAGVSRLEQEVLDLHAVAAAIAGRAQALADEHGVALHLEGEPATTIADPVLLNQAILVLVDNAIKYNRPGGQVTIRTWQDREGTHLEVRDTGIGIAAEHVPRLGERFYRVDKARSRAMGGAGLGLSLARGIAGRHGGSLVIESEPGQGTAAILTLPAVSRTEIGSVAI